MRSAQLLLLGLTMLVPEVCHGQEKCPWINEATASGILGGAVTVTVKVPAQATGTCVFSRQQGVVVHQLRISVNLMSDATKQFPSYLAQCPPKSSPLRAIGNEAVTCSTPGKAGHYGEMVVGRVRNQAFVVTVSSSLRDDPTMTQQMRREKVSLVSEQVSGILF